MIVTIDTIVSMLKAAAGRFAEGVAPGQGSLPWVAGPVPANAGFARPFRIDAKSGDHFLEAVFL